MAIDRTKETLGMRYIVHRLNLGKLQIKMAMKSQFFKFNFLRPSLLPNVVNTCMNPMISIWMLLWAMPKWCLLIQFFQPHCQYQPFISYLSMVHPLDGLPLPWYFLFCNAFNTSSILLAHPLAAVLPSCIPEMGFKHIYIISIKFR